MRNWTAIEKERKLFDSAKFGPGKIDNILRFVGIKKGDKQELGMAPGILL